jgi:hypothetical protein
MQTFSDNRGNTFLLKINIGQVRRVIDATLGKFDLVNPWSMVDGQQLQFYLQSNLPELWEVVYHLVEPQAAKFYGENPAKAFGDAMDETCFPAVRRAFLAEWQDFFPVSDGDGETSGDDSPPPSHWALIHQLVGFVGGIDPDRYTWRELEEIARGVRIRNAGNVALFSAAFNGKADLESYVYGGSPKRKELLISAEESPAVLQALQDKFYSG